MVISSRLEGGANVVSEAIRIGVPILASGISGNVGLLGSDYPGYFRPGDDRELASLMVRAATNVEFLRLLKQRVDSLQTLVAPENEARMLNAVVAATAKVSHR
jgi:glycosyltransferase involved in cell wall biosynthesis